ncbi:MAG: hypothetical protein RIT02_4147 [Planctomycetota bacterium]
MDGAEDIDFRVADGFADADGHAGLGSLMADHFRAKVCKDLLESDWIADIALKELCCGGHVFPTSAAEIVNHRNGPAECDSLFGDVTANESCPTCNQKSHGFLPVMC